MKAVAVPLCTCITAAMGVESLNFFLINVDQRVMVKSRVKNGDERPSISNFS